MDKFNRMKANNQILAQDGISDNETFYDPNLTPFRPAPQK